MVVRATTRAFFTAQLYREQKIVEVKQVREI